MANESCDESRLGEVKLGEKEEPASREDSE